MGTYLYGVGALEWFDDEEEDGYGHIAAALNAELARRGVPLYAPLAHDAAEAEAGTKTDAADAAVVFEEKLVPPMTGFEALCRTHLSPEEAELLLGWEILVPVSLDPAFSVPFEPDDADESMIAGAPQVLPLAQRIVDQLDLPAEFPQSDEALGLTSWLLDGGAKELAEAQPGPWSADLDATFYAVVYLRAAQHSLRFNVPIAYT